MGKDVAFDNVKTLVKNNFRTFREELDDSSKTESELFQLYVSDVYFRNRNLDITEIESGIVDESNDQGIDAVYFFVDGQLLSVPESIDEELIKQDDQDFYDWLGISKASVSNSKVEIFVFQYKKKERFEESVLNNFTVFVNRFFDLNVDWVKELKTNHVSEKLISKMYTWQKLVTLDSGASMEVKFIHAALADDQSNEHNYEAKVDKMIELAEGRNYADSVNFEQIGVYKLRILSKQKASEKRKLISNSGFQATSFGADDDGAIGYFGTIKLSDYFTFITNGDGSDRKLDEGIFDANIRDFMNRSSINVEIERSVKNIGLSVDTVPDFWWLNNGITILADSELQRANSLILTNVQIVNGLQTSFSIYNALKGKDIIDDERGVLVKVIISTDENLKDAIIKSTNSQNAVSSSSLRATDPVQRDIEEYFKERGLYYDRRKNYYRNHGKPISKIIDANYLSQSLVSIVQQNPGRARNNPTVLVKKDSDYKMAFSADTPISSYYAVIRIRKQVESYLKTIDEQSLTPMQADIVKYYSLHISRIVASLLTNIVDPKSMDLDLLVNRDKDVHVSNEIIDEAREILESAIKTLSPATSLQALAKLQTLNVKITAAVQEYLSNEKNLATRV